MTEVAYYSQDDVLVTNARLVVGNKTYNINNIVSAESQVHKPNRFIRLLVSIILLYISLRLVIFATNAFSLPLGGIGILACIAITFLILSNVAKRFFKTKYTLSIRGLMNETFSITLRNNAHLEQITNAINQAIVYQKIHITNCPRCNQVPRIGASFCAYCGLELPSTPGYITPMLYPGGKKLKKEKSIIEALSSGILNFIVSFVTFLPRLVVSILEGISHI